MLLVQSSAISAHCRWLSALLLLAGAYCPLGISNCNGQQSPTTPRTEVSLGRPVFAGNSSGQAKITLGIPKQAVRIARQVEEIPLPTPSRRAIEIPSIDEVLLIVRGKGVLGTNHLAFGLEDAVLQALARSPRLQSFRLEPQIERQRVEEAAGEFNWALFAEATLTDSANSNGLVADASQLNLPGARFQSQVGLRKRTEYGGQVQLSAAAVESPQIEGNDAGNLFSIRLSQEILRESGREVAYSAVISAQLQTAANEYEALAKIADEILSVNGAYWELFRARTSYIVNLQLRTITSEIVRQIEARSEVDANDGLLAQAQAAEHQRQSEVVQSQTAVLSAQASLFRLINSANPSDFNMEVLTITEGSEKESVGSLDQHLRSGLATRPEIQAAYRQIDISNVEHMVAVNALLPQLTLAAEGQFPTSAGVLQSSRASSTSPDFLVSANFEYPIFNQTARGRRNRAELQRGRNQRLLEDTMRQVTQDVSDAFYKVNGYRQQLAPAKSAVDAAFRELNYRTIRRETAPSQDSLPSLELDLLLRAQERYAASLIAYAETLANYNTALYEMRRADGTLINASVL